MLIDTYGGLWVAILHLQRQNRFHYLIGWKAVARFHNWDLGSVLLLACYKV